MEDISPIAAPQRYALAISNEARLQDHRFLGQAVLPAVYAMEYLAEIVGRNFPDVPVTASKDSRFDKFLALPSADISKVAASVEIDVHPGGGIDAVLLTRHVAVKSRITRMKVHARTSFGLPAHEDVPLPQTPAWPDEQPDGYHLPVDRLYAEMVPFGPTFQNVVSPVDLWPEGARAVVSGGPPVAENRSPRLGSPFPLDAAFHVACAWAQRYCGLVAFPVALQQRVIRQRTLPEQNYAACVHFKWSQGDRLIFDVWIHDRDGQLSEFIRGLTMRDVSGGRLQPPAWIRGG